MFLVLKNCGIFLRKFWWCGSYGEIRKYKLEKYVYFLWLCYIDFVIIMIWCNDKKEKLIIFDILFLIWNVLLCDYD